MGRIIDKRWTMRNARKMWTVQKARISSTKAKKEKKMNNERILKIILKTCALCSYSSNAVEYDWGVADKISGIPCFENGIPFYRCRHSKVLDIEQNERRIICKENMEEDNYCFQWPPIPEWCPLPKLEKVKEAGGQ